MTAYIKQLFLKTRYILDELFCCLPKRLLGIRYLGDPKNIVIANFSGIGNILLFTPVLQTLRKVYPEANIIMILAPRGTKEVISGVGIVDEIYECDPLVPGGWTKFRKIAASLRMRSMDLGITYYRNLRAVQFLFMAGCKYRAGYTYKLREFTKTGFLLHAAVDLDPIKHEVLHNLDILGALGIENFVIDPTFYFGKDDLESADKKVGELGIGEKRPTLGFHTGAYRDLEKKMWPARYFAGLGDMLIREFGAQILIFGGPEEKKYVDWIISMMKHGAQNLSGILTLKETAALISVMDLFVSNDSGPMHIAAGVGTPVIGIFGPTHETKNAPWPKEGVPAEVVRYPMDCAPCYVPYSGKIECERADCLERLTPDIVFGRCEAILKRQGFG